MAAHIVPLGRLHLIGISQGEHLARTEESPIDLELEGCRVENNTVVITLCEVSAAHELYDITFVLPRSVLVRGLLEVLCQLNLIEVRE